jgi:hypothetical protein
MEQILASVLAALTPKGPVHQCPSRQYTRFNFETEVAITIKINDFYDDNRQETTYGCLHFPATVSLDRFAAHIARVVMTLMRPNRSISFEPFGKEFSRFNMELVAPLLRYRPFAHKARVFLTHDVSVVECGGVGHTALNNWLSLSVENADYDHLIIEGRISSHARTRYCKAQYLWDGEYIAEAKELKLIIPLGTDDEPVVLDFEGKQYNKLKLRVANPVIIKNLHTSTLNIYGLNGYKGGFTVSLVDSTVVLVNCYPLLNWQDFPRLHGVPEGPWLSAPTFATSLTIEAALKMDGVVPDIPHENECFYDDLRQALMDVELYFGLKRALERTLPAEISEYILELAGTPVPAVTTQLHAFTPPFATHKMFF